MRDITVTLYQFDELPTDKAKERARDWYRSARDGDNYFSEPVLNDAREWLTACGFANIDFRWSGFCSQGDGASFTGNFRAADYSSVVLEMLRADRPAVSPDNAAWHAISARFDKIVAGLPTLLATLTDNGSRYAHENSVSIDIEDSNDGEPLQGNALELWQEFRAVCRDAMRRIYRELESAYDWENANEQIDDALRANEYEFTADGVRHG